MVKLLRRFGFACAAALSMLCGTSAALRAADVTPQELTVDASDIRAPIKLFRALHDGERPAVIILHTRQGLARFSAIYDRYAQALAAKDIDAVEMSYYDETDAAMMASSDRAARQSYFSAHLPAWSKRVHDVVSVMTARPDSSGKIGLLGFSNGGFLAVASAIADPRINALVVFYAGLPDLTANSGGRLPPLLALHGDGDPVIPLSSGRELVERARALGGQAELIVYPGAGHGFDFDLSRHDATDAAERAVNFLAQNLLAHETRPSSD